MHSAIIPLSVEQIVERQIRQWDVARRLRMGEARGAVGEVADFVAISRTAGSRGTEIAARLGERLGWPVFDHQILHAMAGRDEIRERLYETMDERDMGWVEESCRSQFQTAYNWTDYFESLVETVLALARRGPAIFLGRGIDLMLPRAKGLRVRIDASLDVRIRNFAERHRLSGAEAARKVEETDRIREEFLRHHFPKGSDVATRFDLIVNTSSLSVEQTAELLAAALRVRGLIGV